MIHAYHQILAGDHDLDRWPADHHAFLGIVPVLLGVSEFGQDAAPDAGTYLDSVCSIPAHA